MMRQVAMGWTATAVVMATAVLTLTSCRSVLGGFDLVDDAQGGSGAATGGGGGSGGGVGGDSGGSGGQGGSVELPPNLSCSWIDPIIEVHSLQGDPTPEWDKDLRAARVYGGLRLFADRMGQVDVFTVDDPTVNTWSFTGHILQVARVDGLRVGALVDIPVTNNPQLVVQLFDDDDADGSASTATAISDPTAFADIMPNTFHAVFSPVGDGTTGTLGTARFVATFRTAANDYSGAFGLFDGSTPVTPTRFTEYLAVDGNEFKAESLFHHGGDNYFHMGEFTQRQYTFSDTPSPSAPDRELAADTGMLGRIALNADGRFNTQMFTIATTDAVAYVGEVDASALSTVTPAALTSVLTIDDFDQFLTDGETGWFGDTLMTAGSRPADRQVLGLLVAHKLGALQANQDLPFPPSSVVQPNGTVIGAVAVPDHEMVSWAGGSIHIAWTAEYEAPPGPNYQVLYYGQVDCSTVDR